MRRTIIFFLFSALFFLTNQRSEAQVFRYDMYQQLSDSAEVSLLTSTPWDGVIYAYFGHTALRVKDESLNLDYVFNYGIFNTALPNFELRFIKGETDYRVEGIEYGYYIYEYAERGVGVIEQVFNLTQKEKQAVFEFLAINILPENKVYRYNYFYDNCSTRPRDIIEKCVEGTIEYTPTNKEQTYRDLVWECVDWDSWSQFGIDLIIGADADKVITDRQKDFLPLYLMAAYDGATVKNEDGTVRQLVSTTTKILEPNTPRLTFLALQDKSVIDFFDYPATNYPLIVGCLLLLLTILISLLVYNRGMLIVGKFYDTLLFIVAGLGGCIIFFLMFFSEHPCVNPNWNIIWLNLLQLLVGLLFFIKPLSKCIYYYHFINFAALILFLLAWCLIPQQLEVAFIPYILSIALRSGMNILQQRKLKNKAVYSLPRAK